MREQVVREQHRLGVLQVRAGPASARRGAPRPASTSARLRGRSRGVATARGRGRAGTAAESVATWSLRLRPARSLPPSGAEPLDQAALERGVHVLVGGGRARTRPMATSASSSSRPSSMPPARRRRAARRGAAPGRAPGSRRCRTARAASRSAPTSTARRARPPGRRRTGRPTADGCPGAVASPGRRALVRHASGPADRQVAPAPRSCSAGPTARRSPSPATGRTCRRRRRWRGRSRRATSALRRPVTTARPPCSVMPDVAGHVLLRCRR